MKIYTTHFGKCEQVTILSEYSNNPFWVDIQRADGSVTSTKKFYCFKNICEYDSEESEWFPVPQRLTEREWWKITGRNPKYFKPRKPAYKPSWQIRVDPTGVKQFTQLKTAVLFASRIVTKEKKYLEITRQAGVYSSVFVDYNGYVMQFNWNQKNLRNSRTKIHQGKVKKNLSKLIGYKF